MISLNRYVERINNGIITENPLFVQVLATCPTLAVTTSVNNAVGMGLAATAVLICSNFLISALRKLIPDKIRIPAYIVIIACFVTVIDMVMHAYTQGLYKSLGIYIPLIVVNCIILGRAEAYANKNNIISSIFDGIGMGLGFTAALIIVSIFRELFGVGTILGFQIMPVSYKPIGLLVLAPGGFFTLGIVMTIINYVRIKKSTVKETKLTTDIGCAANCSKGCAGCSGKQN